MQIELYTTELDRLIQELYFTIFNRTLKIEDLDFNVAFRSIQDTTLGQYIAFIRLLSNQRAYRASYSNQKAEGQKVDSQDALVRWVYAITSIIYFSWAKKRSNFFSLVVDIYLIGSSIKRRAFKTLAGFRLCYGYYSTNYTIGSITKEVKVYQFLYQYCISISTGLSAKLI